MRSGIMGFILGVAAVIVGLIVLQREAIRAVDDDVSFRFDHYVFADAKFPSGDFEPGRIVHRFLFPSRFKVTFYDAGYHEVKQADKPGRYGAVVRLSLSGDVIYKYITLYRVPGGASWWDASWATTVNLPPQLGLDPGVVQAQQGQIGDALKSDWVSHGKGSPALAILLAGLAETPINASPATTRTNVFARDADWWYGLRDHLGLAPSYPYLVDLPHDDDADPQKKWPLIVYLHSGAERGNDLQKVRRTGLPRLMGEGKQLAAIVVSPQCSGTEWWSTPALLHFLDQVSAKYRIDPDRVYLTGGNETWTLAMAAPERFAAIAPIGPGSDAADAARLKSLPVWAFIDAENEIDPAHRTTVTLDAIAQVGGHPHRSISDGSYDIWDHAYATETLYPWLLAQKRNQPEVATPGVP
jgi:hypothetical protein